MLPGLLAWAGEEKPASDKLDLIKQGLGERRVVTFSYHGYERRAEPHALGRANEGKAALLVWQTGGGSSTEPPPGWRVFFVEEISALKLTDQTFKTPRPDYSAKVKGLKSVEIEVTAASR